MHGRPSALSVRTRVLVNRMGSLACVDTIHGASVEGGPGTGLWEAVHLPDLGREQRAVHQRGASQAVVYL